MVAMVIFRMIAMVMLEVLRLIFFCKLTMAWHPENRELGFEMYERTQSHISLRELDHESHQKIDRPYELLHVLEFSSSRRRMSVIVRNAENQLLLLSKSSDSVMLERLSKNSQDFEAVTMDHVKRYAEAGLRTLVLAYRELSKEEFSSWEKEFLDAKATVGPDRDALIEAAADKIERDLILLGATAVEDKLMKPNSKLQLIAFETKGIKPKPHIGMNFHSPNFAFNPTTAEKM
ncbi:putative phospholipid-transporting ATPase 8 [Salvia divinorum]|uniref:Phospholipid-transporting ATPase 8 n=1 Tax=Salvia divinorum TaxID=28513 RepID=A0ABD1HE87_SALDI